MVEVEHNIAIHVTTELAKQGNLNSIIVDGKKTTFEKLSNETGIPASTLSQRYQKGLRGDKLLEEGITVCPFSNVRSK